MTHRDLVSESLHVVQARLKQPLQVQNGERQAKATQVKHTSGINHPLPPIPILNPHVPLQYLPQIHRH